jgi:hypothetical protein
VTIKRGEPWGEVVERPRVLVEAPDDAAVAAHLAGRDPRPVLVTGGDLLRTLGGRAADGRVRRYPVDLLRVVLDGTTEVPAVAHVVVRRPGRRGWWRGPLWAACNVGAIGPWDVAPRAHPDDGRLDVVHVAASMSLRARAQARRRLRTGSHLPHPDIAVSRATTAAWRPEPAAVVIVDGTPPRRAAELAVVVEPDAGVVHA